MFIHVRIIYVDNIVIFDPSLHIIDDLKFFLCSHFELTYLGFMKYFLGLKTTRFNDESYICLNVIALYNY